MKIKKNHAQMFHGFTGLFAVLLAMVLCGTSIAYENAAIVNGVLSIAKPEKGNDASAYRYKSAYSTTSELVEAREALMKQISEEGSVLLKNEGNALPLSEGSNLTLFGIRSHYPIYAGDIGSNIGDPSQVESLEDCFTKRFHLNKTMIDFYAGQKDDRTPPDATTYITGEVDIASSVKASYSKYGDAAICVISRSSSEEKDYSVRETVDGVPNVSPMALSKKEKAMLEEAKSNFDKVIVLVNSDNMMEIEELKNDPAIDAILWVGLPGALGFNGIADALAGASPSGHLSDIYVTDVASSPATVNYGDYTFSNAKEITEDTRYDASKYVVQAEGIYLGYKYYETRYYDTLTDADGTNANTAAGSTVGSSWNYSNEVSYSFGYGLSYTTFNQEIVKDSLSIDTANGTGSVQVKVTNTGTVAGKDVVQLYVQAPYTEYDKINNVEKAAVSLLGFTKTESLKAGESETVTVEFNPQYLASYDYTNAKTYILDGGIYYFSIGNGAHDALNNILANQGVEGLVDTAGNITAGDVAKAVTYDLGTAGEVDTTTYATSKNGTKITNLFDDADYNYYKPDTVTYLTRKDWNTFPIEYKDLTAEKEMSDSLLNNTYTAAASTNTSEIQWGEAGKMKVAEMVGKSFDDANWTALISQLSLADAIRMIQKFQSNTEEGFPAISMYGWSVYDGPIGMYTTYGTQVKNENNPYVVDSNDKYANYNTATFNTAPVLASTFSIELATSEGEIFGNDSLWNDYSTLLGPGMNLHRTPLCGRNHEYYSEDAMLTNYISTAVCSGMKKYGAVAILKHYAFNSQETNRQGISTFMNEQQIRETELRAFQGSCESNEAGGVMTAYNRVGIENCASNDALLNGILRDEWGFTGCAVTDAVYKMYLPYFDWKESMANGGAMMLATSSLWQAGTILEAVEKDATLSKSVYDSVHYALYTYVNSGFMNGVSTDSTMSAVSPWWEKAVISLDVVVGLITVLFALLYIRAKRRNKVQTELGGKYE